jgi:catechol 2,3-dioxygenase-like lactoylglutathione lyase family enzyme
MKVKRIVTNLAAPDVSQAKQFYAEVLGLEVVMDQGWIVTLAAPAKMAPQISIASEGGSGTPVPDLSVEVDDRRCRSLAIFRLEPSNFSVRLPWLQCKG